MSTLKEIFSRTLLSHLWQEFRVRYRFKYVLPKIKETTLDGIRLDLSTLSLKSRNRLLMGIYEEHEKHLCLDFLTADDSVVEVGSAIGFIGLFCQKKIGIKNYVLFEANPETLQVLRENYALNGLTPAASNLALAPRDGPLNLEVESDFWENTILQSNGGGPRRTVSVPGASFRSLLQRVGQPFNVLIIDVEGAEQFIDPDEIPESVTKIIIELHPDALGPEKTYELIGGLLRNGFYVAREEAGTFAFLRRRKEQPPFGRRTGRESESPAPVREPSIG